jgi:hypothetical protein
MKKVGILYGHLEYYTAIWYILCQLGNLMAFGRFPTILVH